MSIWNWIGASPEINDSIPEIGESISLVRKIQNSELTPEQRNKVLKNSCNLKVIFSNARLRFSLSHPKILIPTQQSKKLFNFIIRLALRLSQIINLLSSQVVLVQI